MSMKSVFVGALADLFLLAGVAAQAQPTPTKTVRLYPAGQGVDQGIVEGGKAVTLGPGESNGLTGPAQDRGGLRWGNVGDDARMDLYIPAKCNGQMIVICPGGGYSYCSSDGEGAKAADWCLQHGIAACVLIYRMPNGHAAVPLTDVQNAFRYCRAHAAEWGVKQIGIMGFSAGGHLAAYASTLPADELTRPDFSVLIYPVITLEEFITHAGTRQNLLGTRAWRNQVEYYSLENRVTRDTPPALLICCADDGAVPPENSIRYFRAMQRFGVKGELHILSSGGHGFGFNTAANNGGRDALGAEQRADFFRTLERWLGARQ